MPTNTSGPGREMYHNISIIPVISEISANALHPGEVVAGLEASEPVCDGQPFGPASPKDAVGQKASGSEISPTLRFEWITAQWAWSSQAGRAGEPRRLRVTLSFLMPEEIGTRQQPHRITFNLTDRRREFRPANQFQQRCLTLSALADDRWIGKARLRQPRGQPVATQHRRNIPDLVMTARIDQAQAVIRARLYTPQQTIDLVFDQPLSLAQQKYYEGAARWGRLPRARPRDDFYDWLRYA